MRGKLSAILILVISLVVTGCAHRSRPEEKTQLTYVSKPVIDFGRGGGGLPIEGFKQVHSAAELLQGITQGYHSRVEMPRDHEAITVDGQFPRLDLLRIDLSNATLKKEFRPHQFKKPSAPQPIVFTKQFEYIARPIRYADGPIEMYITARDAEMSLIRDGDQASLVLTNASEGSFEFSMNVADVRPMLMAGAREHASGGFSVRDIIFEAHSNSDRSLSVDLVVKANWLLLPADFHLTGRVDIDDAFNVRLSGLRCDGENLGGLLLAGFIDEAMQKHNGKVMPLAAWPGNKIGLSHAQIQIDDHIRIKAGFGPTPTVAKGN
jgi:hypothetical protein